MNFIIYVSNTGGQESNFFSYEDVFYGDHPGVYVAPEKSLSTVGHIEVEGMDEALDYLYHLTTTGDWRGERPKYRCQFVPEPPKDLIKDLL
ncbi:MAG: hypothetical protein KDJ28_18915 [Candidatus Competibacteraceae bacterium]|nr:hypothetical protein [Candidatus Competibacteraceae bacterium]